MSQCLLNLLFAVLIQGHEIPPHHRNRLVGHSVGIRCVNSTERYYNQLGGIQGGGETREYFSFLTQFSARLDEGMRVVVVDKRGVRTGASESLGQSI